MTDDMQAISPAQLRLLALESLRLWSSYELQSEYAVSMPLADVPLEVVLSWRDFFDREVLRRLKGVSAFCSPEQHAALVAFDAKLEELIDPIDEWSDRIEIVQAMPQWRAMAEAAEVALAAFAVSELNI